MHNRKEYFWCELCKRWTPSHGTSTDRGSKAKNTTSNDVEVAAHLAMDPSVWYMASDSPSEDAFKHVASAKHGSIDSILWFAIGYYALVFYFMPRSSAGRMTSLLGLWQSLMPLVSLLIQSSSGVIAIAIRSFLSAVNSGLLLATDIPFSCCLAPLLWSLLYLAISFSDSLSKNENKSKSRSHHRVRVGRVKDPSINKWYRSRRRGGHSAFKMSLRNRLRNKTREDIKKKLDSFELDPWDKAHWKSKRCKSRSGRCRTCTGAAGHYARTCTSTARHHAVRPKSFKSQRQLKFRSKHEKIFPEFKFVNVNRYSPDNACPPPMPQFGRQNKPQRREHPRYAKKQGRKRSRFASPPCDANPADLNRALAFDWMYPSINVNSNFKSDSPVASNHRKHSNFPLIWDSGASVCVCPNREDFIEYSTSVSIPKLSGYAKGQDEYVVGEGTVLWSIEDEKGMLRTLKLRACHLPGSKHRLIATNAVTSTYRPELFVIGDEGARLTGVEGDSSRGSIFVPLNLASKLLVSIGHIFNGSCVPGASSSFVNAATSSHLSNNQNLSGAEKELLSWHEKLGHLAFSKIQFLMRSGVLASSEVARRLHRSAAALKPLRCAACIFAKQKARSVPGRYSTAIVDSRSGILQKDNLLPGQEISVDHFICSQKGRLFTSRGKTADKDMFKGGCIFCDHASNYVHVEFQTVLISHATLGSKLAFEQLCHDHGVYPQRYLSDNGTAFTGKEFSTHLREFRQTTRFAGVGAHHHNGHAERSIQTIMSISRAMMIHASLHWPDMADSCLWPMAVQHAVFLWNHVPDPTTGLSPSDLFTKTRWNQSKFHDLHVWGCPTYVLDKKISDGHKIPRWKPRSTRCVYLGCAPSYASSVPLVLNPSTGSITPQFHVVFDDSFHTVDSDPSKFPDFNSDEWLKMFGESTYQYVFDDDDLLHLRELSDELEGAADHARATSLREQVMDAAERVRPLEPASATWRERKESATASVPLPSASRSNATDNDFTHASRASRSPLRPSLPYSPVSPTTAPSDLTATQSPSLKPTESAVKPTESPVKPTHPTLQPTAPAPTLRRSNRRALHEATEENSNMTKRAFTCIGSSILACGDHFESLFSACGTTSINAASKSDPDTLSFEQAMSDSHKEKWLAAAEEEIRALERHGAWLEVPFDEARNKNIVPSTWVFKVKRTPDGDIKKFKARLCLRGDLMRGVTDTYAPVVAFSTVRIFLIMSIISKWETCSIDFSNAFIQAKREKPIYIRAPRGFHTKGEHKVLKLIKSLYGAKDAPRLWMKLLFASFKEFGLVQSEYDPCLWMEEKNFIITFVDDCGICYKNKSILDNFFEFLHKKKFTFTKESSFEEYLGIKYIHLANGSIHLIQSGLIEKILDATNLKDCHANKQPARKEPLGIDPDGESFAESWDYSSVVGMLLYLSNNTRPDITFAVSQVARFTHQPKKSHGIAVKTIIRYLKGTANQGTIIHPVTSLLLTCFCDADFAGLFRHDPDSSLSSAKSRSAFIISLSGCPLIWKSQLQSTIALSTAESEYYSLSIAMRTLLPIRRLILDMIHQVAFPEFMQLESHQFQATVREDNTSALNLATEQQITSRTRHYQVRWHHFWQNVREGDATVEYVETKEQDADYLTKSNALVVFMNNRFRVQGW